MTNAGAEFWTDDTSVLFTSFWGWRPEEWATVGWSKARGRTYRDNVLKRLTDPFITVVYVTRDPDGYDLDLVGKAAGFYLMSHEKGHRNDFTHPVHHGRYPEKWEHSLRALRAFTYISDPLPIAKQIEPALSTGAAQSIAGWGKILENRDQINKLRNTPWREVAMYRPGIPIETCDDLLPADAMVPAGPIASQPFLVSPGAGLMYRRLYVLRLHGDMEAYLGKPASGHNIYKIGLSVSPDDRRRTLQKGMPRGAFIWKTERASPVDAVYPAMAAVAGEDAMKRYLAGVCGRERHLGGEFYLASKDEIHEAWITGIAQADQTSEDNKHA